MLTKLHMKQLLNTTTSPSPAVRDSGRTNKSKILKAGLDRWAKFHIPLPGLVRNRKSKFLDEIRRAFSSAILVGEESQLSQVESEDKTGRSKEDLTFPGSRRIINIETNNLAICFAFPSFSLCALSSGMHQNQEEKR